MKTNTFKAQEQEKAKLQKFEKFYVERLQLLHKIDKIILSADAIEDILELSVKYLKGYHNCFRVSLVLIDQSELTFQIAACESDVESAVLTKSSLPLSHFRLTKHFYDGNPLLINNINLELQKTTLEIELLEEGIISYVSIPLIHSGELIGALNLSHTSESFFDNEDIEMAKEIANSISIAIIQQKLKKEIIRQSERLELIRNIEHSIINQHSTKKIAEAATIKIREFLNCKQAAVVLFDFAENYLELIADDSVIPIGTNIGERVPLDLYNIAEEILNYEPAYEIDLSLKANKSVIETNIYRNGILSYISLPLVAYNELLGVFNLSSDRANAFNKENIETANDIARSLAIALYQSKMREQILAQNVDLELIVEQRTKQLTQANMQLTESKIVMQHIADNVPGAVFRYSIYQDFRYRIDFISRGCREIFGLSADAILGKGFEVLSIMPADRQPFFDSLLESRDRLCQWSWEFRIMNSRTSGMRWIRVLAQPAIDENKTITWTGTFTDISKLIHYQDEIIRLNGELKENIVQLQAANSELEAFSYSVSHDLRSPLRSMNGFSEVLVEEYFDKLDDLGKDYLSRIQAGSNKMARLIDDLLKLSRLTRTDLQKQELDLIPIAQEIIDELKKANPNRKATFEIKNSLIVYADAASAKILLTNLIGNAWKFTSKCEDTIIELNTTVIDSKEFIFIRDNGAGFDSTYLHKIFGAFQRLHTDKEFEGTGVGLAIAQRIINKHGGKIFAESTIYNGATFYFHF